MSFLGSAALLARYSSSVKYVFSALEMRHSTIKITNDFCSITTCEYVETSDLQTIP